MRLFRNKIELSVGQVWERTKLNPFSGTWRSEITDIQDGYVKYLPYYVDEKGNRSSIGGVELWEHSEKEKDFRFFNTVLVSN